MAYTIAEVLAEAVADVARWAHSSVDRTGVTDHIPHRVLHWLFLALVVVFFLDEFVILAAIFGGPVAALILIGIAGLFVLEHRTHLASRTWTRTKSSVLPGSRNGRYRTRKRRNKK